MSVMTDFRDRLRAIAPGTILALAAAATPMATPAITLSAGFNDHLSQAANVTASLGPVGTGSATYEVNTAGATSEFLEEVPVAYPGSPETRYGGSLWLRVRSPNTGGISLAFDSFVRPAGSLISTGFVPYFNIHAIPAGSVPSFPLSPAIANVPGYYILNPGIPDDIFSYADYDFPNRPESDYLIRLQVPSNPLGGTLVISVRPDGDAPTVVVDSAIPTSGPVAFDSTTFAFSGRATEGQPGLIATNPVSGLASVECRVDLGVAFSATLTKFTDSTGYYTTGSWSANVAVAPGPHVFEVRSVDGAGNVSPWREVRFVRSGAGTTPQPEPDDAEMRDSQSFAIDDPRFTGWIGGTYYVDQARLEYSGAVFGPGRRTYTLNSRGWPINVVYDLATGSVTGLLSLPGR